MSPVIAFDLAVVAQKVKVQCCYIMADMPSGIAWYCMVSYLIIVADAADAVSVNFSGRCKFLQI